MKIKITTRVKCDYKQVVNGFNMDLLKKLNPPFPPVKILEYEGNEPGNIVVLELNFIFLSRNG